MKRRILVLMMCAVLAAISLAGCASDKASKLALKAAEAYDEGNLDAAYDYYQDMLAVDTSFTNDNTKYLQEKFVAHDVALCDRLYEGVKMSIEKDDIVEQLLASAQKGDLIVTVTAKGIRCDNTVLYNAAKSMLGVGNNKFYSEEYKNETFTVTVSLDGDGKLTSSCGFKDKPVIERPIAVFV